MSNTEYFDQLFAKKIDARGNSKNIIEIQNVKFTLIFPQLLRVERGNFLDNASQRIIKRNFGEVQFSYSLKGNFVIISTTKAVFKYNLQKKKMQSVSLLDGRAVSDFESENLKGTARTLDMVNGACKLDSGVISKSGVAIFDDSKSCVLKDDGTFAERKNCKDEYYFAFGYDYRAAVKALTDISGKIPLIPRYCLGNWWSRYKAYTQQEYLELMQRFIDEQIPISVATIDMDWHWIDVIKRFGKDAAFQREGLPLHNLLEVFQSQGWTGYSWNTELFPDYKMMLNTLHEQNFKVTLNLHPAQGVRPFEDQYEQMAEAMDMDPKAKEHIKFDITNPLFVQNYFKILHKPYESEGVDFWWIDWQQERTTKIKGLDPLWALNHYHTLAFGDTNKRPLILSRYGGIGSHRFPLGFSGDTITTWKSLDFQPYFTITAANCAYSWWSHDIGGHQLGSRDDELYARWVQFGQFSPIMRLHSTSDEFMGKEPWKYSSPAKAAATNALRQRHQLIPYIYSQNKRCHDLSIPLCEPVYYQYPAENEAYECKNEYFFGSQLLVNPITAPADKTTNLASTRTWLPKGRWTDIYTGYIYQGGKFVTMNRDIGSIPVLAKEGAIIPLSSNGLSNDWSNPEDMTIKIFRGTGSFVLYEDDGETMDFEKGCFAETKFQIRQVGQDIYFIICKATGQLDCIPQMRNYTLDFEDIIDFDNAEISINSKLQSQMIFEKQSKKIRLSACISPNDELSIKLCNIVARQNESKMELIIERLSKLQMSTIKKKLQFDKYLKNISAKINTNNESIKSAIAEIFEMK